MRTLLARHREHIKSGRELARILHGISSPRHLGQNWRKMACWGRYLHVNFNVLQQVAQEELATM